MTKVRLVLLPLLLIIAPTWPQSLPGTNYPKARARVRVETRVEVTPSYAYPTAPVTPAYQTTQYTPPPAPPPVSPFAIPTISALLDHLEAAVQSPSAYAPYVPGMLQRARDLLATEGEGWSDEARGQVLNVVQMALDLVEKKGKWGYYDVNGKLAAGMLELLGNVRSLVDVEERLGEVRGRRGR